MSNPFVHPTAICEAATIGSGTRIWAFAHLLPGSVVGRDCNICDHTFVEGDVIIGDRVTVKCGVQLWDGVRLEDDVFVGPNATFTNDRFPRSKVYPERFLETRVKVRASIGANATILPGLVIGEGAMVGAGAVVTRSVPPNAIVAGNPARIVGYVDSRRPAPSRPTQAHPEKETGSHLTSVDGVTVHRLRLAKDLRGSLAAGEFSADVPFQPRRYFLVFDVPSAEVRGEHAHRKCHQFMACIRGSCAIVVDDGVRREELILDSPYQGVYVPPMIWAVQYRYSADAVLLVFASDPYDPMDYIRDYQDFTEARRLAQRGSSNAG